MATNFDKTMQPLDIASLLGEDDGLTEVEVLPDEGEEPVEEETPPLGFDANLLPSLTDEDRAAMATDLWQALQIDKNSRNDWETGLKEAVKLLGLKYEQRTEPWADACGLYSSVLLEAVIRFQSETVMETFPASGPVKTVILGAQTPEKVAAAARVKEDMNYQLTEVMPEFRAEHLER